MKIKKKGKEGGTGAFQSVILIRIPIKQGITCIKEGSLKGQRPFFYSTKTL
jgi:hypothetical protein